MEKAVWLPFAAILLQAAGPVAGGCPPPDKVADRMDDYFANPRSPATYRALAGLGDPLLAPFPYAYSGQESQFRASLEWQEHNALAARMLPEQRPDPGYWQPEEGRCRLDHPLWLARARVAALGDGHPYVRQWFAVQKAVFEACINRTAQGAPPLPGPIKLADAALAALQAEDRAYQQASRLFYEQSPRASEAFRTIAASGSRHAPIARYMMLVIKVERVPPEPPTDPRQKRLPDVPAILAEAKAIIADPRLASVHPLTQALIGSLAWNSAHDYGDSGLAGKAVELRTAQIRLALQALRLPTKRLLSDRAAGERYSRAAADVEDFQRNMVKTSWLPSAALPRDAYTSRALAAAARRDPLAAWMILPPSPFESFTAWASSPSRPAAALRRYVGRQRRDPAWLAVRVAQAEHYDPAHWRRLERGMAKARLCAPDRDLALLPTLFHHQVRAALMYGGRGAGRRRAFARSLSLIERWPWRESAHFGQTVGDALNYLVAAGRLSEARRLRSRTLFLKDHGRALPALLLARNEDELVRQMARAEDFENTAGVPLFERLSVASLGRLAARDEVPAEYRKLFARVAWTRLYASGRPIPAALDSLMRRLNPEITHRWRSPAGAPVGDPRLLLDVLGSPGLTIVMTRMDPGYPDRNSPGLTGIDIWSHSDKNWWCAWQIERHRLGAAAALHEQFLSGRDGPKDESEIERAPRRLGAVLRQSWLWRSTASAAEQDKLAGIDCAPKRLAEAAVRWTGAPGGAEGQDEALALAVRATRYGCQRQGGHGAYSKAAFELLHRRFPQSPAARRTRYWFDCSHFYQGCPPPPASAGTG